jgi:hypothetical protein
MTISDNDIKTITLVGSTRFPEVWAKAMRDLTIAGNIVHTVGLFGHQEDLDMNSPLKRLLDRVYLKKIRQSDKIFVLNKDGYIGMGAWDEIMYAIAQDKEIVFLEPLSSELKDDFLELCRLEGWEIIGQPDIPNQHSEVYAINRVSSRLFDVALKNNGTLEIRDFRNFSGSL